MPIKPIAGPNFRVAWSAQTPRAGPNEGSALHAIRVIPIRIFHNDGGGGILHENARSIRHELLRLPIRRERLFLLRSVTGPVMA